MASKKKNLFLYTDVFPFSTGETFIEHEIFILSNFFDKIFIQPRKKKFLYENKITCRKLPKNFIILEPLKNLNIIGLYQTLKKIKLKDLFKIIIYIPFILKIIIKESSKDSFKYFSNRIKIFPFILLNALKLFKSNKSILKNPNTIILSYWMYEQFTELSILKAIGKINHFYCRGHGNDLYSENIGAYKILFRNFELNNVTKAFCVSKNGEAYLKNRYGFSNKISHSYLGTRYIGENLPSKDNILRIVSCSNIYPLKRIDRLINILNLLDFPIIWTHFGDVPRFYDQSYKKTFTNKIKQLNKNICFFHKGFVPNSVVLEHYKNKPVDLFINLSETEGVPVSILEATSFGIPVIATNVGGTSEALPINTKFLISKNFKDEEVASLISSIFNLNQNEIKRLRLQHFEHWNAHFNASITYSLFYKELIKEHFNLFSHI